MRFISKNFRCKRFDKYVKKKKSLLWERFDPDVKLNLHQHLWREQKGLCIYCQQLIPPKERKNTNFDAHPSHIEHIKPKSLFKYLTFAYKNLAVACNGFNCASEDTRAEFCEFKKQNLYDSALFLNPTEVVDIEDYFVYDIDGNIKPSMERSEEDIRKANYMIELLSLQSPTLKAMRISQMDIFLEDFNNGVDVGTYMDKQNKLYPGFYSMLKQFFQTELERIIEEDIQ
jgi:uncharacterized protein (TIGR02646 family)